MIINHHPAEPLLLGYAAGTLDAGEQVALATHLLHCGACRAFVGAMESGGGSLLDELPAEAMASDALSRLEARLDEPWSEPPGAAPANDRLKDVPGLPAYVRSLPAASWSWVAPGLHIQRLKTPAASPTRVFLLRARAGTRLLQHGHDGVEMTCILSGSFSHDGQRYARGDFDFGADESDHDIAIGSECACICLVAMRGKLQLRGILGRLIQPLIAI